jgi:CRP/FNR family cyclic AMP-dependent transcriptional regulator
MTVRKPASMWALAMEGLSASEARAVAEAMRSRSFPPRTMLYREGAPCAGVSIVERGRVRSFHSTPGGKEFTNLVSGQGALLGLVSIVLDAPAVISVESLDPVVVSQIERSDLLALMHAVPRLSFNFNRVIASAYMDGVARGRRSIDTAPVRLGKVLVKLAALESADADADSAGGEIRGLTQQDLAAMVDTTRSWVAQMLGSFENLGLVQCRRGVIRVPDLALLLQHVARFDAPGPG